MKKSSIVIALLLIVLAVFMAGCTGEEVKSKDNEEVVETVQKTFAKSGIWIGKAEGDTYSDYLYVMEDATSGSILSIETGMGSAFEYTVNEDGTVGFRFGAVDAEIQLANIINKDEDHFTIEWQDGRKNEYTYVQKNTEFDFYSNEELCDMALEHYARHNEGEAPSLAGAMTNEDMTVTIQLYDNFEGHNSTAAYYTIDRVTAQGTNNSTEEVIDLKN